MCRLMAQIAVRPRSAGDILAEGRCSLLAQSDWKKDRRQQDGWGIAHYRDGDPEAKVVKSAGAAFKQAERFRRAARAESRIVIGHIRHASNPKGLPKKALIGTLNAQPF